MKATNKWLTHFRIRNQSQKGSFSLSFHFESFLGRQRKRSQEVGQTATESPPTNWGEVVCILDTSHDENDC